MTRREKKQIKVVLTKVDELKETFIEGLTLLTFTVNDFKTCLERNCYRIKANGRKRKE